MSAPQNPWYEISIGWEKRKSWFLVDELDWIPNRPRTVVEVTTTNGATSEIVIRVQFPRLPTMADGMKVVLAETGMDLSGEVALNLTSWQDSVAHRPNFLTQGELERMRRCGLAKVKGETS